MRNRHTFVDVVVVASFCFWAPSTSVTK